MTDEELEQLFRLLCAVHELSNRLQGIERSKFPAPEAHKEDVRNYQQGWNDAIDFIMSCEK